TNSTPREKAPNRKYLTAPYSELTGSRAKPARTYSEIERISSPRKMVRRFSLEAISDIPETANWTRAKNSPKAYPSALRWFTDERTVSRATTTRIRWNARASGWVRTAASNGELRSPRTRTDTAGAPARAT